MDNIIKVDDNVYFVPMQQAMISLTEEKQRQLQQMDTNEQDDYLSWVAEQVKTKINFKYEIKKVQRPEYCKAAEVLLTDKCNLACKYCYSGGYRSEKTMSEEFCREMVKKLFLNAYISKVSGKKEDTVYLLFHGGGEPTQAWERLVFTVEYAKELSNKYKIKVSFAIASNGVFSQEKLDYLMNNKFKFRISIDGIGKVNDITRRSIDNNSVYDVIANNLDQLNESGLTFFTASVVTPENIDEMYHFVEYGIKRWNNLYDMRFFMLEETELTQANEMNLVNMVKFQELLYKTRELMIKEKIGTYQKYSSLEDYLVRNHKGSCMPSIMHMPVFNVNGDILRCNAHVFDPNAKIGELKDGKLVFDSTVYPRLCANIKGKVNEECNHCIANQYCEFGADSCVQPLSKTKEYCTYMEESFRNILKTIWDDPSLLSDVSVVNLDDNGMKRMISWRI